MLTKAQARLLAMCSDKTFEFMKTSSQERDAFDMYRAGLLERQFEVYRFKRGGQDVEMRWTYRRTDAGRAAVAIPVQSTLRAEPSPPRAPHYARAEKR